MTKSALQIARAAYQPKLPKALKGAVKAVAGAATQSVADQEAIQKLFPNTYGMPLIKFEATDEVVNFPAMNVGVILSGGQAPGGHNVISGIFDGIKSLNKDSKLYGFILGPGGLVDHNYMELTSDIIDEYRNTGGFDIIGSGRTKLEKEDQFEKGLEILKQLDIKALVIIGGDDSNTNACVLAEYYAAKKCGVQVIGCPKTIDGDLKNEMIETSFGFDTACKVYSEVIGNIQRDCNSARKYWHFIKLMGRSASHIALECALQVQPNVCIVSEEVEAKDMSLDDVVTYIAQIVANRAAQGNNFGTVLIPEGLIEFIPAMKRLIAELNDFLAENAEEFSQIKKSHQRDYIIRKLSPENAAIYASLPEGVARQLTLDRDPHGNVQVSLIETEKLLSEMVATKLAAWKEEVVAKWDSIEIVSCDKLEDLKAGDIESGKEYTITYVIDEKGLNDAVGLELVTTYTTADGKQHVYSVEPFSVIKKEGDLYTFQVKHSLSNAGSFKVSYRMFPKNPELPHRQDFCYVRWFI